MEALRTLLAFLFLMTLLALALFLNALMNCAKAHVNDRGMDYNRYEQWNGMPCCGNADCMPVTYYHGKNGIVIFPYGQRTEIPWSKVNPKRSTDNRAHWCGFWRPSYFAKNERWIALLTLCVILPPEAV